MEYENNSLLEDWEYSISYDETKELADSQNDESLAELEALKIDQPELTAETAILREFGYF